MERVITGQLLSYFVDNRLINVQRRFTKRLPGLKNLTYKQRLVATNLNTLELRRPRTDLVVCYQIVFGLIKVDVNNFFSFAPVSNTRGHRYKLFVEQSTRNVRHHFFLSTSC